MIMKKVSKIVNGVRVVEAVELAGAELEAYNAALAKPKVKRREGEFREFLSLFTTAEQIAIKTAAMDTDNVVLALWYDKALGGASMSLDHPETEAGLSALVSAGLIDADRKAEILATDFDLA